MIHEINNNKINQKQQQQQVLHDAASLPTVKCDKCGNTSFQEALIMKKVSAILSETGKVGYYPIPVFSCTMCGHINQEFLPEQLRDKPKLTNDKD